MPDSLPAAFAIAAIPARYAVERRSWAEAAKLQVPPVATTLSKFPWTTAMITFARALGDAHTGDLAAAKAEIAKLEATRDALKAGNKYWSDQIEAQRRAAAAVLASAEGRRDDAVRELRVATDLEDGMEKHPVTPGSIVPLRELLGDLLLETGQPAAALAEYEHSLENAPNRFRTLYDAAKAANAAGDRVKARQYFEKLIELAGKADTPLPELVEATAYLAR